MLTLTLTNWAGLPCANPPTSSTRSILYFPPRKVFTSTRDVDYTPDVRKRIVLVPPADFMKEWSDDYEAMRSAMVFGSSLAFDALIERLHLLEERFHQ